MAEVTDIEVPRGSRVTLSFALTPAGSLSGTIKFTVARRENSATKIIAAKACTITNGATGTYTCVLTSTETDVTPAEYFWDSRIVDSGSETLLGSGKFTITPIAQLPA